MTSEQEAARVMAEAVLNSAVGQNLFRLSGACLKRDSHSELLTFRSGSRRCRLSVEPGAVYEFRTQVDEQDAHETIIGPVERCFRTDSADIAIISILWFDLHKHCGFSREALFSRSPNGLLRDHGEGVCVDWPDGSWAEFFGADRLLTTLGVDWMREQGIEALTQAHLDEALGSRRPRRRTGSDKLRAVASREITVDRWERWRSAPACEVERRNPWKRLFRRR